MTKMEPGDVLDGTVMVVDDCTFVVLDQVRGLKQGAGRCGFVMADGAVIEATLSPSPTAFDFAPLLAKALAERDNQPD